MNVWRLMAHREDPEKVVEWSRREERIAMGWDAMLTSPKNISEAVRDGSDSQPNWPYSGQQLWDFSRTMEKDDLVILSTGSHRAVVMQVTGDYEYCPEFGNPFAKWPYEVNQRKAVVTALNPDALWNLAGKRAVGYGVRWTLIRCGKEVTQAGLRLML